MRRLASLTAVLTLAAATSAEAASTFTIRGAGFGHGVGMSQYGAYGFALNGSSYDDILSHYYTDTELGDTGTETVRVLLQPSQTASEFTGARAVNGKRLKPRVAYTVRHGSSGDSAAVFQGRRKIAQAPVLRVRGNRGTVVLGGIGTYRGGLEYRAAGTLGIQAVNAVDLENYIRGVVALESPSSWPAEALKAQAVAARTYAMTSSKGGNGFDHYPDTRSQVYGGVKAETASTDDAVADTDGEVVTYDGEPVTTYFFSTSGGRTEDVENTSLGNEPLPWLKSVKDPYDDESPKHRWSTRLAMGSADAKLGSLVKGTFKGIDVVSRGRSPRIVEADVVGTGGRTRTDGATLRARLGLFDTWAFFTTVKTSVARNTRARTLLGRAADVAAGRYRITGQVIPSERLGTVVVEHQTRRGWKRVGETSTTRRGHYEFATSVPGRYRVKHRGAVGPVVRAGR